MSGPFQNDALARRAAQLRVINEVANKIAAVLDLEQVLVTAARLIQQRFGYHHVGLFTLENDRQALVMRAAAGSFVHLYPVEHTIRVGDGMVGWAAGHNKKLLANDVTQNPVYVNFYPDLIPTQAELSVPIRASDELLGVLDVQSPDLDAFDENDVLVIETLADQIAVAIQNAHLYRAVQVELAERRRAEGALRESRRMLATLMSNLPGMAYRCHNDRDWTLQFVSEGCLELTGYAAADLVDKRVISYEQLIHPDDRAYVWDEIQSALSRGQPFRLTYRLISRDGTEKWVWEQGRRVTLRGKAEIFLEGFVVDITERIQAEQALQHYAQQLEALRQVSQDLAALRELDALLYLIVERAMALIGADDGGIYLYRPGRQVLEWVVMIGEELARKGVILHRGEGVAGKVWASGESLIVRDYARWPGRAPQWADVESGAVVGVPIQWGAEFLGVIVASSRQRGSNFAPGDADLLGQFAAQAAIAIENARLYQRVQQQAEDLSAQQQRLWSVLENLPEGVALLDPAGQILLANPAAANPLGLLAGRRVGEVLTSLGSYSLAQVLQHERQAMPLSISADEPGDQIFEVSAHTIAWPGTEDQGAIVVLRDVTETRKIEEQMRAQERLAAVGQLAGGIAHDFNNILTTIILYAQMFRRKEYPPERLERGLTTIYQQAQRATDLVRRILDFARSSWIEFEPVDLQAFIQEQAEILKRTIPENIQLRVEVEPGQYAVAADVTRLQQILINLVVNARDAMPTGGDLYIALSRLTIGPAETPPVAEMAAGEWVCLTVADSGTGMTSEVQDHLFEPFFTTKPEGQGTGLGLAQVYGLVRQHGGQIDVESELNQGTTFRVYLPLHLAQENETEAPADTPVDLRGQGEVILIVEDNEAIRELSVSLLVTLGYRVLTAIDGEEALDVYAAAEEVDLVLTDLVMPKMGGRELMHRLRQRAPQLKALAMSGYAVGIEPDQLRQEGIVNTISKPFEADELARAIRMALDGD